MRHGWLARKLGLGVLFLGGVAGAARGDEPPSALADIGTPAGRPAVAPAVFPPSAPIARVVPIRATSTAKIVTGVSQPAEAITTEPFTTAPVIVTEVYGARPYRGWASLEYLHWWTHQQVFPPLVTTSPAGTAFADAGLLGGPATSILAGGREGTDQSGASGARLTIAAWLDDVHRIGIETSLFGFETNVGRFSGVSDAAGNPILSRPVVSTLLGTETTVSATFPGAFSGAIDVASTTQLFGAEVNFFEALPEGNENVQAIFGFRYLGLEEALDIRQSTFPLAGGLTAFQGTPVLAPNGLRIRDTFATRNNFYGAQIGLRGTVERGNLTLDAAAKLAFGWTVQTIHVAGSTELVTPTGSGGIANGGVLALASNIGGERRHDASVIPAFEFKLGYKFTDSLSAFVGYDALYWSRVVRPSDQIDRNVNSTQQPSSLAFGNLVGEARPARLFNDADFWAQGVSFGIAIRY